MPTTNLPLTTVAAQLLESFKKQAGEQAYIEVDDQLYFAASKVDSVEIRERILLERHLVRFFVTSVLAREDFQYAISIFDGEETPVRRSRDLSEIMAEIGACDEEWVNVSCEKTRIGSLFLVYGNGGWDVIADSTDTERFNDLLKATDELVNAIGDVI